MIITAAPLAETRMRGFQAGGRTGRQRAEMINACADTNEHSFRSFDRYNNLVCSRHVELRACCRLNSLRIVS